MLRPVGNIGSLPKPCKSLSQVVDLLCPLIKLRGSRLLILAKPSRKEPELSSQSKSIGVETHHYRQAVMLFGIDHTVTFGHRGVEKALGCGKHLMINDGSHEFTRSCSAQQSVQIDVADPPENKRVRFTTELGPAKEGNV